ncbi:hypothetical protein HF078_16035 [Bacillus sp. RO2]|uniref:hypothetical protein n=1 Tax=Bacillus sp. RO2 TaxID=2723913 RepID=UPI00145D1272|nr:hypothetical protein [Bacillus sp. RO2]NMH74594.1 hypothetical protein [Bacillus sp. RO2]
MENLKRLHILNGQEMYNDFEKRNFLNNEMMIPFNEAMCFGNVCENLFSEKFNNMRAKAHHVTEAQYREITLRPLEVLFNGSFTHIELWFDADMFCQMNVLTVLALLDQKEYNGPIDLHVVDEQSDYSLKAKGYFQLYKQVFINKKMPTTVYPEVLKRGLKDTYIF